MEVKLTVIAFAILIISTIIFILFWIFQNKLESNEKFRLIFRIIIWLISIISIPTCVFSYKQHIIWIYYITIPITSIVIGVGMIRFFTGIVTIISLLIGRVCKYIRTYNILRFVKNQTPEKCLSAVKKNGSMLLYVKEQTPEICLAAVENDACSLILVKEQTLEICLAAFHQDEYAINYIRDQGMKEMIMNQMEPLKVPESGWKFINRKNYILRHMKI